MDNGVFCRKCNYFLRRAEGDESKYECPGCEGEVLAQMLRLNLGSGDKPIDGWENIDRKNETEAYPLECEDNSVDEIRASHILEHFPTVEVPKVLKHWVEKLKPGGVIKISVPDFRKITDAYRDGKKINISGVVMGGQVDKNDYHKSLFDQAALGKLMQFAGLVNIESWKSEHDDCAKLPISLNLMGVKGTTVEIKSDKIKAVISMPRLGFTDNFHTAIVSLGALGIELVKGCGVFWDQILSRMTDEMIGRGAETIITLDYDTWFTENHIKAMLWLLDKYPEADAICPVQMKREYDEPLCGVIAEDGREVSGTGNTDFSDEITPIKTAHFGMTFFRAASFAKLKKPWMVGVPNENGDWGEGRQDPDIYFWNNWHNCGLKLYQANKVPIAHLQMMATFPGKPEDDFKPIHVYMHDLDMGRIPEHCIL